MIFPSKIFGNFLDKVDNEKLILERCISLEKDIQSDRRQMQQVIDAKQRLIEKQVSFQKNFLSSKVFFLKTLRAKMDLQG